MFKSVNNKIIIKGQLLCCYLLLSVTSLYGQKLNDHDYTRFVDSAENYIDETSNKSESFLDSIPKPIEKYINGRLADYFTLKALIHDSKSEYAQQYQNFILALKYAEKEKNYKVAGDACIELFSGIYFAKKDTTAFKYLDKAQKYYALANYKYGLLEIEQMYSYIHFLDGEYKVCNNQILKHLDKYRKLKDNPYFSMFATYMLTANYIELSDFKSAYIYFNEFKNFKHNQKVVAYNYYSFESTLDMQLAMVYFDKKQLDSTKFYLSKSAKLRNFMIGDVQKDYFNLKVNLAKYYGDIEESKTYIDSLLIFEKKIFKNIVIAGYQLNAPLLDAESELEVESDKKFRNGIMALVLFCIIICLIIFYFIYYKKYKFKLNDFNDIASNFSYLKFTNEKLTGKVRGLEEYISSLKKDIKEISTIHDISLQREKIKELYTTVHINSSALLDKSESHLELVNDLNVEFFNQIHLKYPELNDSEVITCYYLFMGFKNKEIAMFLNTSIRALESRRYRISKKIEYDYDKETTTLVKHLKKTFKSSQVE